MKNIEMAKKIAERVHNHGGQTYFVGGYVRDKILGKENKDIDIEVHNIIPKVLKSILSELGEIKTQGASFGVYNIKGYDIDIAQPRSEIATGRGHKDFEVSVDPFIGTEKASMRRDFTINALMEDVITGEIVDHFNGVQDIENGIIRHINDTTFKEDALRVFRAAQFAARFGFDIADETIDIMSTMDVSTLSRERVYEEMKKAMIKAPMPSTFFNVLKMANQLDVWFPEVKALIGCPQNPKYHPEGDVWNHTMMVIDNAATMRESVSNAEFFMIAALCHDFGKPVATCITEKGVQSIKHDIMGVPIAKEFMARINNNVDLNKYVLNMVENHMALHQSFNNKSKIKSTNAKFDISICPSDMVMLTIADSMGKTNTENEEAEWITERLNIYKDRMSKPEVMGKDLMAMGIMPGPIYSEILKNTHKQHLSGRDKESVLKDIATRYGKKGV